MLPKILPGVYRGVFTPASLRYLLQRTLPFIVHIKTDNVDNRLDLRLVQLLCRLDRIPTAGLDPVAHHVDDVLHFLPRLPAQIALRLLNCRRKWSPARRAELV